MGGCNDPLRPYPPPRQTPLNQKMSDLDPSLCFDVSEYGHLGYDPDLGPPDPDGPVQDQYTGTWDFTLSLMMIRGLVKCWQSMCLITFFSNKSSFFRF